MGKLVVAVGSKNPVKVNSVRNAFAANFPGSDLEVVGYSVPSGVDDQPWGDVQTRQGALNRAENALGAHCLAHGGAPPPNLDLDVAATPPAASALIAKKG